MNQFFAIDDRNNSDANHYLAPEDNSSAEGLDEAFLLADTLEEDHDRYQDVIRDLTEFEESHAQDETKAQT